MLHRSSQDLETFMRGHDDKNRKKVEELAQSMLNGHIMVSTVTSELQEFKNRSKALSEKVGKAACVQTLRFIEKLLSSEQLTTNQRTGCFMVRIF